eukprot:GGOE01055353.1.p1 GENE.GGOE01055353.1~~GGOE01055353.1.p1  ORF type:complete len:180 (-),score=50.39 GGOE01055353.1:178-717(-)
MEGDMEMRVSSVLSVESLGMNVYQPMKVEACQRSLAAYAETKLPEGQTGEEGISGVAKSSSMKLPPLPGCGEKPPPLRQPSLPLNSIPVLSPVSRMEKSPKSPRSSPKGSKVAPAPAFDSGIAQEVLMSPKVSKRALQKVAFDYTSGHTLAAFHFPPIGEPPPSLPQRLMSLFSLKRMT